MTKEDKLWNCYTLSTIIGIISGGLTLVIEIVMIIKLALTKSFGLELAFLAIALYLLFALAALIIAPITYKRYIRTLRSNRRCK